MNYKSPLRKLKRNCSVCSRRCTGKICRLCFNEHYWTKEKRAEMACRVKAGEIKAHKEIKRRLKHLM